MKLTKEIEKLQKNVEKELKEEKSYLEMLEAFTNLEKSGVTFEEPKYNLQTVENIGRIIPTFSHSF
jgi:hypothetical protein